MELRQPPQITPAPPTNGPRLAWLFAAQAVTLVAIITLGAVFLLRGEAGEDREVERLRKVAGMLKAAEADSLGAQGLQEHINEKVVHTLERLGRVAAAQAALNARTGLATDGAAHAESDPIVAKIGPDEIHRSEVERSLEQLPPQLQQIF